MRFRAALATSAFHNGGTMSYGGVSSGAGSLSGCWSGGGGSGGSVVSMSASAAAALAAPHPVFTYRLGNSVYVPLTSRCNTRTLPSTRGPNFLLPPDVVAALCRVRDAEANHIKWEPWCQWLDTQEIEFLQKMPQPLETISSYYEGCTGTQDSSNNEEQEDPIRPTANELLDELRPYLRLGDNSSNPSISAISSIVFAGEGEPLLRLLTLTTMIRQIREEQATTTQQLSIRVNTNGLVSSFVNDDDKNDDADVTSIPQMLQDCGVNLISIALMTHDPKQYDELMEPNINSASFATTSAHESVCEFIRAVASTDGLQVEITAVERPDVNKLETEQLARELLLSSPSSNGSVDGDKIVRWRPYFP